MTAEHINFTHLIESLAWPVVVLIVTALFFRQWRDLIGQIRTFRIGVGSVAIERSLTKAVRTGNSANESAMSSDPIEEDDENLCSEDGPPPTVMMTAWNRVSISLQLAYLRQFGVQSSTRSATQQINKLRDLHAIDVRTANTLNALRRGRNTLAFNKSDAASLSLSQALRYQLAAEDMVRILDACSTK
jgi:hypothetical protein